MLGLRAGCGLWFRERPGEAGVNMKKLGVPRASSQGAGRPGFSPPGRLGEEGAALAEETQASMVEGSLESGCPEARERGCITQRPVESENRPLSGQDSYLVTMAETPVNPNKPKQLDAKAFAVF